MDREKRSGFGRVGLIYMLAVAGLSLGLLLPSAAAAQGLKDPPREDPATEEPGTDDPVEPVSPADLEDAGLIDDRSYESPQFGYTVDWSRDWAVDSYYDDKEDGPSVKSDTENEQDLIYLVWVADDETPSYAILSGQSANRGGGDADVEAWLDPDFIEDQWNPNFEVEAILDDTTRISGAVLYSVVDTDESDAQYYTIYQSMELEDGTTLYVTFSAYEDWFEDAYDSWSTDVELNGQPVEMVFAWADIEGAIDAGV